MSGLHLDQEEFASVITGLDKTCDTPVGLRDPGYRIWPNPSSDKVYFRSNMDYTYLKVEVFNMQGENVLTRRLKPGDPLQVSRLISGLYYCSFVIDGLRWKTLLVVE
jgi:hypothetical protein